MKRQMKMLITDDGPVQDVLTARAKEHHERTTEMGRLMNLGHVRPVEDNCATHITVEVQDEFFTDVRERFPTTELMARVQLAIAAGRSCNNGTSMTAERLDRVWVDENYSHRAEVIAQGYANVSALTAAVRKPRKDGSDWLV